MFCPLCGKSNPAGAAYCNGCGKPLPTFSTTVSCPFCGADGQEYQINCTKCGKELPRGLKVQPPGAVAAPSITTKTCQQCGRPMSIYDTECPFCRQSSIEAYDGYYVDDRGYAQSESDVSVIGGVLILIAGVLGLVYGLLTLAAVSTVYSDVYGSSVPGSVTCCALLMALFGLIAMFGGYNGIKRESLAFAIAGGVLGIFSIGFLIGALLSLIGVILVAVAHRDFSS